MTLVMQKVVSLWRPSTRLLRQIQQRMLPLAMSVAMVARAPKSTTVMRTRHVMCEMHEVVGTRLIMLAAQCLFCLLPRIVASYDRFLQYSPWRRTTRSTDHFLRAVRPSLSNSDPVRPDAEERFCLPMKHNPARTHARICVAVSYLIELGQWMPCSSNNSRRRLHHRR
jgi:hypothetical protein